MTEPKPTLRYLNRADVEAAGVTTLEVIDAVDAGFRAKGSGDVELPAKTAVHPGSPDSFIHACSSLRLPRQRLLPLHPAH